MARYGLPFTSSKRLFREGVAWGILEALSLLIGEAKSFNLSLNGLGLDKTDIDQQLANLVRKGARHARKAETEISKPTSRD